MQGSRATDFSAITVSVITALLTGLGCNGGTRSTGTSPSAPWQTFAQPDGRFSVELPGKPIASDHSTTTTAGAIPMHFTGVQTTDGDFELGYSNISRIRNRMTDSQIADALRDDLGVVFGTRNMRVSKASCGIYQGFEYRMDVHDDPSSGTIIGDFRIFIANNYIYEQFVIGHADLVQGPRRDRFFSSLHINKPAATSGQR